MPRKVTKVEASHTFAEHTASLLRIARAVAESDRDPLFRLELNGHLDRVITLLREDTKRVEQEVRLLKKAETRGR